METKFCTDVLHLLRYPALMRHAAKVVRGVYTCINCSWSLHIVETYLLHIVIVPVVGLKRSYRISLQITYLLEPSEEMVETDMWDLLLFMLTSGQVGIFS